MISEAPRGAGESAKQHCASPWGPGAGRVLPKPWPDILSEPFLGSQSKARVFSPALSTGVEDPLSFTCLDPCLGLTCLGSLSFTDLCCRGRAGQTQTALAELLVTVDMEPVGMQWSERHLSDPKKAANTKYKSSKASRCTGQSQDLGSGVCGEGEPWVVHAVCTPSSFSPPTRD